MSLLTFRFRRSRSQKLRFYMGMFGRSGVCIQQSMKTLRRASVLLDRAFDAGKAYGLAFPNLNGNGLPHCLTI
jgi:hypothetical protein